MNSVSFVSLRVLRVLRVLPSISPLAINPWRNQLNTYPLARSCVDRRRDVVHAVVLVLRFVCHLLSFECRLPYDWNILSSSYCFLFCFVFCFVLFCLFVVQRCCSFVLNSLIWKYATVFLFYVLCCLLSYSFLLPSCLSCPSCHSWRGLDAGQ